MALLVIGLTCNSLRSLLEKERQLRGRDKPVNELASLRATGYLFQACVEFVCTLLPTAELTVTAILYSNEVENISLTYQHHIPPNTFREVIVKFDR